MNEGPSDIDDINPRDILKIAEARKQKNYARANNLIEIVKAELGLDGSRESKTTEGLLWRCTYDVGDFLNKIDEKEDAGLLKESDTEKIERALSLMMQLHIGQEDRADGTGPFIKHPIEVASGVLDTYKEDDLADVCIAALFHDTIEDQAELVRIMQGDSNVQGIEGENAHEKRYHSIEYIKELFGERVASLVEKVSTPLPLHDIDFKKKKKREKYYKFVKDIIDDTDDPAAFVIKWQDARSNMLTIDKIWKRAADLNKTARKFERQGEESISKNFEEESIKREAIYTKLRNKYRPILEDILLPAFENMKGDHSLYKQREGAISDINEALNEKYNLDR